MRAQRLCPDPDRMNFAHRRPSDWRAFIDNSTGPFLDFNPKKAVAPDLFSGDLGCEHPRTQLPGYDAIRGRGGHSFGLHPAHPAAAVDDVYYSVPGGGYSPPKVLKASRIYLTSMPVLRGSGAPGVAKNPARHLVFWRD